MKQNRFGGQKRGERAQVPSPVPDKQQVAPPVEPVEDELSGDEEIESMPNNLEDCFSAEEIELIQKIQKLTGEIRQGVKGIQTVETYVPSMIKSIANAAHGLILEAGETINEKELTENTVCYNREAVIRNLKRGSQVFDRSLSDEKEGVRGIAAGWENAPDEIKAKMEELSVVAKELISLFDRE